MSHAFSVEGLEVTPELAQTLERVGIVEPTEVQRAAFGPTLAGRDVVIQSSTGTGKTLAYLLPLLQRMRANAQLRVLIVAPGPELAMQILRVVETYKGAGVSSCGLVGGGNVERQKDKLKTHPRIMVGTPGRVLELIYARKLKTRDIGVLVLDETDEVLSLKNENQLREIASRPEFAPQLVFASATIGPAAQKLAQDLMKPDFLHLTLNATKLPNTLSHHFITFEESRKEVWLTKLLSEQRMKRALVFVNKLQSVPHIDRFLNERGIASAALSGEHHKQARADAIDAFKKGRVKVLVTTDAVARGLDFPELDWVVHYDVARSEDVYLHRAGRVGRAGRPGTSVMMVGGPEMFLLQKYNDALGIELTRL